MIQTHLLSSRTGSLHLVDTVGEFCFFASIHCEDPDAKQTDVRISLSLGIQQGR